MKADRRPNQSLSVFLTNNQQGFSLIELIITLVIMGILVGVLSPSLFRYIEEAKISKYLSDADTLRRCYELASIEVISEQEIFPQGSGVINILNGTLSPDPTNARNNDYNQAVKDVLDTIFTSNYDKMHYSLRYQPSGTIDELYIRYEDGRKHYDLGYNPLEPASLLNNGYEQIGSSGWYLLRPQ